MLYLATPPTRDREEQYRRYGLGFMLTYGRWGARMPPGIPVAVDNGCYSQPERYSDDGYLAWLDGLDRSILWATAPDVLGDAEATLQRALPMLQRIRSIEHRAAFVLQDGCSSELVPWEELDAVFIGGTTDWKLGPEARALVAEAGQRGVAAHMGRVNSLRRLWYAHRIGCESSDGTKVAFGPDLWVPLMGRGVLAIRSQTELPL